MVEKGKLCSAAESSVWKYDDGGDGWIHIRNNHVINPSGNVFVEKFGSAYSDEAKIQELIMDGAKYGVKQSDGTFLYTKSTDEKLKLTIGDNGYIVTTYPFTP